MLSKSLLAGVAIVASTAFFFVPHPVEAGSCRVIVAEGRGATEAKASARAVKHLTFKINRWASKNGYTTVRSGASSNVCSSKGALVHCIASRKVCG